MIWIIYIFICIYFILGGIAFYFIKRKKDIVATCKSYTKFGVYFISVNILFKSIALNSQMFRAMGLLIIFIGFLELLKLYREDGFMESVFFGSPLLMYAVLSTAFYLFSVLEKEFILFSFLIFPIFDSFSQITSQLLGQKKILPAISPKKTLGRLIGGAVIAIASSLLLRKFYSGSIIYVLITASGIVVFAFIGDVLTSLYKRKYKVKDFSKLIPGHGGIFDRFDSIVIRGVDCICFSFFLGI